MNILKYAFDVTPTKRRVISALVMVVTLTSTNVQTARAEEVLPEPPVWTTETLADNDTTVARGLVVPDGLPKVQAPKTVEVKVVKAEAKTTETKSLAEKPVRKKWNTINSADLETKADHSSEGALRTMVVPTSAYTSDPGETDSSPFTTANGTRVYDGVIAANFLKFGTRVRIPEYFGDKVFVVHDRMNARYNQRVDIWMTKKADAFKWGVRRVKIEILP